jgi:hypothetical protein
MDYGSWTQLGSDVDGKEVNDSQGFSVSLSGDGLTLAVGATGHDSNKGTVRTYNYNGTTWSQIGSDLDGTDINDYQGSSVSLSKDGTTLAVGAYGHDSNKGTVRLYQYDSNTWIQLGTDLDGDSISDYHGRSVSLSGDGLTLAVGATGFNNNTGAARVYKYDSSTWTQLGEDIIGSIAEDYHGNSISISSSGTTLAVGAWGHDSYKGTARVYRYASSAWSQIGEDLDGEAADDYQGWSVSLSSNGLTLAVGAYGHDSNKGTVRIYNIEAEKSGSANRGTVTLNSQSSNWTQIGNDIDGSGSSSDSSGERWSSTLDGEAGDKQGYSVSISSDGITLAVGALGHDNNKGTIRAYSLVNDAPEAIAQSVTVDEQTAIDVTLSATDSDPNTSFVYKIITLPIDGELSENGIIINSENLPKTISTNKLSYISNSDIATSDSFTFKASDGSVDSQSATVSIAITAVNDAPLANADSVTTIEDIPLEIILTGTDVEGDTLTYIIVDNPTSGTISLEGVKASFVSNSGFFGSDSFTFKVNDGTIDSEKVTVSITVTSNDLDEDGVLNDKDKCPETPEGAMVDFDGCTIFTLPFNNNKVSVISATCIGTTDGSIGLSIEDASYDYSITVSGKDDPIVITGENKTASVSGLAKGTYSVCFTVTGQAEYEQCFEVVIGEPKALSAFIDVDNDNRTTSIQLSGSSSYNVEINGERFEVKGDNFTSKLSTGLNIIKVSTNLDCQGIIEKEVFISEDIMYYPNPTQKDVSVHVSGEDTRVMVSVFSEKGDLIYSKEQQIQDFSRKTHIDLSLQITGTYIVVMEGKTVRKTFKIVKR